MAVITLDARDFLQPKLVEDLANDKIETKLNFIDVFDVVPTNATTVSYAQDLVTAGDDISSGKMGTPLPMGELSKLSEIEVSPISRKHGALEVFGYKIKVSERDIDRGEVIDDLNRAVNRATYGMAKKVNDDQVAVLKTAPSLNDITEPGASFTAWGDSDPNPVSDVLDIAEAMDLDNYESELTDLYLHKTNYYEFLDYLQSIDINWVLNPMDNTARGIPPVEGVNIHKLKSSELSEGYYLGLCQTPGYQALTTYAYHPNGVGSDGTYPLISVNQYKEQEHPRNVVTEFTAEMFHALKAPNSVCYRSGV